MSLVEALNETVDSFKGLENAFNISRSRILSIPELEELKVFNDRILTAILVSAYLHRNQRRKTGQPYITHPLRAALSLRRIKNKNMSEVAFDEMFVSALFHDLLEDTGLKYDELENISSELGLKNVSKIVFQLTRKEGEYGNSHFDFDKDSFPNLEDYKFPKRKYYERLLESGNLEVLVVKLLDGLDNLKSPPLQLALRKSLEEKLTVEKVRRPIRKADIVYYPEAFVWQITDGRLFINYFFNPTMSLLQKRRGELGSLGIDFERLKNLAKYQYSLIEKVENNDWISELPLYYKFRSKRLKERVEEIYRELTSIVSYIVSKSEKVCEEENMPCPDSYILEHFFKLVAKQKCEGIVFDKNKIGNLNVAYPDINQTYELLLDNEIKNGEFSFFINSRLLRNKPEKFDVYLRLPIMILDSRVFVYVKVSKSFI